MTQAERQADLSGSEVAITGRLASMSREEAVARIRRAGGRYVARPSPATDLVVVGQGGPALGADGRLTETLRRAQDLARAGHPVVIVPEQGLLQRLGLHDHQQEIRRLFTTAQVARMLDLPVARVRTWVRQRLLHPVRVVQRLHFFDFQQVASARSLLLLTDQGVGPARLRASLEQLTALGADAPRALAQLEILERGGPLLVRLADGRLAEPDGQLRLGFDAPGAPPAAALPAPARSPAGPPPRDAATWFERGCMAEDEGRLDDALAAYERAEAADPQLPEVAFNRGNVLFAQGRSEEAARAYRRATELDAEYVEAWNNLGNVLSELERLEAAVAAYERALAVAPSYADAHFNLAESLAARGNLAAARMHWQAYLAQDPVSPWADTVRRRLAESDGG